MKRNFKVIKHDKTLSNLSDADIDKLYNTYIEMDGKHQNFKGSKREYCSTVAGMIKEWLKEVVDKNGGISDKSLSGGEMRSLSSLKGGKGTRKGILEKKKPIEKTIQKASDKITELKGRIYAADDFITKTFKNKKDRITKANNKKIKDAEAKLNDILTIPPPGKFLKDGKEVYDLKSITARNFVTTPKELDEIYEKVISPTPSPLQIRFKGKTYDEIKKHYKDLEKKYAKERDDVYNDPRLFERSTSKKVIDKYEKDLADAVIYKASVEKEIKDAKESKATALSDLATEKTKTEAEKAEYLERITALEAYKERKEAEIKSVEEEEGRYLEKKAVDFGKTIKNIAFSNRRAVAETETFVKKVDDRRVTTDEYYTLQELVNEADDYKRVIKFFLGGKLYTDYDVGIQGSEEVKTVKRFLKALPYKKLLEISPEGYAERVKFVDALIAEGDYFKMRGEFVKWSPEIEESFRSESFVFWKLLAKDIKDKDVVVNNFELLGKIFSRALFFAPVDFRLKYFTGDSKGVKTTSTIVTRYGRDPVVGLAKILSVLNESASYDASGNITTFNNPRIIFTFYRDSQTPDGKSLMLKYTQDKDKFTGKLPYELLLDYDLKKLLSCPRGGEIKEMLQNAKRDGTTLQSKDNLETLREIVNELYNTGTTRNPNLFPVKDDDDVEKRYELSLAMSNNPKIRKDLNIVGYSKDIFVGKPPTILNYVNNYRQSDDTEIVSAIRNFDGSDIKDFVFKSLVGDSAVVTEVDIGDDDDDDDDDGDDEPVRIEGYFREGETETQRQIRQDDEKKKKEAEESAAKIAAMKESIRLSKEKKAADEAAAVAKKEKLQKMREERDARIAKQAAEPKQPVIRKKIIKKSESAPIEDTDTEEMKPLTKLTEAQKAVLREEEGSDDDEAITTASVAKKNVKIAKGKPKSYIKKIIKYYQ